MVPFSARKRATKDNGDGMLILSFSTKPINIDYQLKSSPVKTPYKIAIALPDQTIDRTRGIRWPITDLGTGDIAINFAILPNSLNDTILYAPKDTELRIHLEHDTSEDSNNIICLSPEERRKTLTRLSIICKEIAFYEWLKINHDKDNILKIVEKTPELIEAATTEAILRIIQAHSRSEILNSAIISDKAENIIRLYRNSRF